MTRFGIILKIIFELGQDGTRVYRSAAGSLARSTPVNTVVRLRYPLLRASWTVCGVWTRDTRLLNQPLGYEFRFISPKVNQLHEQSEPTVRTMERAKRVLDYCATYPSIVLRFHANNMTLHVDSNTAYLVGSKARSRIAEYCYLSSLPDRSKLRSLNGSILVEYRTLWHVVASAVEAEAAGSFYNA